MLVLYSRRKEYPVLLLVSVASYIIYVLVCIPNESKFLLLGISAQFGREGICNYCILIIHNYFFQFCTILCLDILEHHWLCNLRLLNLLNILGLVD